ncbi:DUF4127 family protein [Haloactinopolyspora sp.]|uniref:DUF4127 family protein n=1 Tax=Haloactinopolyspora sp. TaxID=1966353 RepID=UPI00260AEC8E|nr:DUF4127 family protein [Haloactinopolyspora sp.]
MPRIALLPPDERPNTGGYAATIGRCAGVDVLTPPAEAMPKFRAPANTAALADWLATVSAEVDHVVVSLDLLAHGGLVPSRNTVDPIGEVIPRLDVLRELDAPVTAFGVVTRLPTYDDPGRSRQEPEYWASHGERLGTLSTVWDEHQLGEVDDDAVAAARACVPAGYVRDLIRRRVRNHVVNLAALEMAADGVFETLVITSDDTAPRGLPAGERRSLAAWIDRLGVEVLTYPGADEVPSVLIARTALEAAGIVPTIAVICPDGDGMDRVAPYEDRPVRVGLANQIRALGAAEVRDPGEADLVVVVHPPAAVPGDWVMNPPDPDRRSRPGPVVDAARELLDAGHRVALADVHYANGSDVELLDALDAAGVLARLTAYGGWNTAGNTIGTTLAAGITPVLSTDESAEAHRRRFLARKIVEDGHYLPVVRRAIQDEAFARGLADPPLEELPALCERITTELRAWAGGVNALAGLTITDARLPWTDTFTVDFDIDLE